MKVLVVARTKVGGDRVCVGGVDAGSGRSVRLRDRDGYFFRNDHAIRPGELWNMQYSPATNRRPPHMEDVLVTDEWRLDPVDDMRAAIVDLIDPWDCELDAIFDGRLGVTDSGRAFLRHEPSPLQYSTGFWIARQTLRLSKFEEHGQSYWVPDGERIRSVKYVGLDDPSTLIPQGALVRFALARWAEFPKGVGEERCFLLLSGWYA